ncbi:MAG: histidine--tRNA ligase [Lactobacillaceae bacterium]|jgi:histidyl-tRNA synthetase|nr:histidine--tRNA ligase [Lactobacillaceae bacterium]
MTEKQYQKPKGTADILPVNQPKWQQIQTAANKIFSHQYGFGKIETPVFENFELFSRSAGETSDVVSKEMYDFYDKGDRRIALRPEGTAGVVRAYVENKLYGPEYEKPVNLYYLESMYRYERPQSGRLREFHQLGVESFGSDSTKLDATQISMVLDFFEEVGLNRNQLMVSINSLGNSQSRDNYRQTLIEYLNQYKDKLSTDSLTRLENNPLRILDSKDPDDIEIVKNAPSILDSLDEESRIRFEQVQADLQNLNIPYQIDSNLVRGLDYYNHTIFEIVSDSKELGSASTIAGGGRYNGMVQDFGGPETPAIGFAIGLERLLTLMPEVENKDTLDVYIVKADEQADDLIMSLGYKLRKQFNLSVQMDYNNRSLKSQFKSADRLKAKFTIIIGNDELASNSISIKNMDSGQQIQVSLHDIKKENFEV